MTVDQIESANQMFLWGMFVGYKVVLFDGTIAFVPLDPANMDYVVVQQWLALQNPN